MTNFWKSAVFGLALTAFTASVPAALQAQVRSYHDRDHNDDHEWNNHEDRAYRIWWRNDHRRYRGFDRLNERDRQAYWNWRHEHSDAVLKIDIR